jgi:dTDP-4-amino-4,6-dideoxygalactose transaminase
LPYIDTILAERKKVVDFYNDNLNSSKLQTLNIREHTKWNYSYYPIILDSEETLLKVQKALNEKQIFPRRYFYPSLNTVNFIKNTEMPISESISKRVMCLPLYVGLKTEDLETITSIINQNI